MKPITVLELTSNSVKVLVGYELDRQPPSFMRNDFVDAQLLNK